MSPLLFSVYTLSQLALSAACVPRLAVLLTSLSSSWSLVVVRLSVFFSAVLVVRLSCGFPELSCCGLWIPRRFLLWSSPDDLRFANHLLQEAKESSDDGLFFKSGLFTWNKMEMLTITDASFGNESNFRSQKRADDFSHWTRFVWQKRYGVHLIGYSSTIIGRVCRSTLQAETYALSDGVEESMRLRAALADAHGVFLRTDWEYHTARFMRNVWMIDCNSLNDHLRNPTFTKCSDKRLSVDVAAFRQMVWLTPDGELREKSDQISPTW